MTRVFLFRPEPGFSATMADGQALGLAMAGEPLFEVEPVAWEVADPLPFDGLLVGSANVFRHGGPGLARLSGLAVLAVGEATARAAREAGFAVARTGVGGLQKLLDDMPAQSIHLLRLAGEERVELHPRANQRISERVIYRVVERRLSGETIGALRDGGIVLLHSANAGKSLARCCDEEGIDRQRLRIAALAPRIAEAAGAGWASVELAETPENGALLALALYMCKND
ncbi:MAG: uroporphyrinogen-III synthase [Altererythrobacter sp.]|nr:uroporphyrinogen-III synthase [Altererythrobacter sp.]